MGCPYSGDVDPKLVRNLTDQLLDMGCYEVSLGDTIGTGTPEKTRHLLEHFSDVDINLLAAHFHDTGNTALENLLVALEFGISAIDCSVGGLGGCPYAKKVVGNVCTENVVYMLENGLGEWFFLFLLFLGINTGIDLQKLVREAEWICKKVDRSTEYIF